MTLDELKSALWGAAVLLRGKINATGYKEYIFPLVFFKRISDVHQEEYKKALELSGGDEEFAADKENYTFVIPEKCLWDDVRELTENVGQALVTAWTRIEQANPDRVVGDRVVEGLGGIFGKRDHWTNKNLLPDQTLSELIEHFSKLDLSIASCPADEMGNAYEYLVGKFADDAGNTAQEFYTNRTVVELMAEILEPKAGESIYDPTCGTGGMLISCIARCKARGTTAPHPETWGTTAPHPENWREIKAYGQEQNALTSSVARMNLFLHGVEEFRIVNDDTLLRPGFLNAGQLKTFNVVLANPPYSIKQWNRELFSNDPFGRNFLGTPPQGRADYAFIQHILKSMDPKTGRAAILLPHGVLFREEEKHIRKALIENDLVEAVIGLAPNLFYNSPMEACVMVCRTNKSKKAKGRILFINAVGEVTRKNAESKLETWHIEKILKAYSERTSDGTFAYDATIEEIAAKDWSLAISLYAHVGAGSRGGAEERSLEDVIKDFGGSSSEVLSQLSEFSEEFSLSPSLRLPAPPREQISAENVSRGEAETRRVKFGDIAINSVAKKKPTAEDVVHYIGLEHIDPGSFTISRWGGDVAPVGDKLLMKKGDLLFGKRRAYQRKVAIAPFDGIFSAHGMVLRPKTDVVDERYFPFFIASDQFMDMAVKISVGGLSPTINWKTLRECEFNLPSLARQRELADLLWAANDLKESYKKMIVATDEMLKAKFREMFGGGDGDCDCSRGEAERRSKWKVCKGKELFRLSSGKFLSSEKRLDSGVPVYGGNGIAWYTDKSLVNSDTLVFGRVGEYCGNVRLVRHPAWVTDNAIFIKDFKDDSFDLYFLYYYCKWINFARFASETGQPKITQAPLEDFEYHIPPLSLQREFVAIAEKADAAKAALKKSIADIDQVMKGLING
ncbi:MAG: N-6 DNA methylase [Kiritimatiellae bacterium]|nr:N-6 DNA methylase [Kiritimatiellia bacterium]